VFAVPLGTSALLVTPTNIQRWAVGEPLVAEVVELSPNELIINGKKLGTTTLIVWQTGQAPRVYSVEVTVDTPALERYLRAALPGEEIQVSASGNSVTLSGTVKDPNSVDRAVEIARGTGVAAVINNLVAPPAVQVLLRVRVAEVNRSALKDFATAFATLNPQNLDSDGDWSGSTISDGIIDFLLSNPNANLSAVISAAISRGNFRSLAEPNLLTLPGREASFLAGGEFPYPTVQGGTQFGQAITITFREFGVRLRFTPTITRSGSIRLKVAPEVSSLDFANGITLQGFEVPSILTRRAETEVELREGQYLALAGLIDNSTLENVTKIPILGDIPILGEFFKSRSARQRQTELLVLITPKLITASETPPAIPTGEPETWRWPGWMRRALQDQVPIPPPGP
jgi:pilus assembly protein CpaC